MDIVASDIKSASSFISILVLLRQEKREPCNNKQTPEESENIDLKPSSVCFFLDVNGESHFPRSPDPCEQTAASSTEGDHQGSGVPHNPWLTAEAVGLNLLSQSWCGTAHLKEPQRSGHATCQLEMQTHRRSLIT